MENKKPPRREREKLRQRQEMLAAALSLFSEKGFHNVSMQEIAVKAEFAIGTLYKFFKNKEDLYKVLNLEKAENFHEALTKAIEEEDDEIEKLRNYVNAKAEVFRDHVSFIRLYFAETRGASFNIMAGLDREIREKYGQFLLALASVFESGMKRKRFQKTAEPYHLALALDSICNAFLFLWLENPELNPYPEDPDTILNILFKGLVVNTQVDRLKAEG
jgi:TetR/AcrR family transcriptional regulator